MVTEVELFDSVRFLFVGLDDKKEKWVHKTICSLAFWTLLPT
jgi:hypothetical protein